MDRLDVRQAVREVMFSDEFRRVVRDTAEEASSKALEGMSIKLGIDHEKPLEQQADFRWLRRARLGSETISNKVITAVAGSLTVSLLTLLVVGFRVWSQSH